VVLYSSCLAAGLDNALTEDQHLRAEGEAIEHKRALAHEYQECLAQLAAELSDCQGTVSEGVARLAATRQGRNPHWVKALRIMYQVDSEQECFAINIVRETEFQLTYRGQGPCAATRRLAEEYRALFGHDMPPSETALKPAPYPPAPSELGSSQG
jgi:hypothetical protein